MEIKNPLHKSNRKICIEDVNIDMEIHLEH